MNSTRASVAGKAGFSGKKHNIRMEIDGLEIHLFLIDAPHKEKKKGLF